MANGLTFQNNIQPQYHYVRYPRQTNRSDRVIIVSLIHTVYFLIIVYSFTVVYVQSKYHLFWAKSTYCTINCHPFLGYKIAHGFMYALLVVGSTLNS